MLNNYLKILYFYYIGHATFLTYTRKYSILFLKIKCTQMNNRDNITVKILNYILRKTILYFGGSGDYTKNVEP